MEDFSTLRAVNESCFVRGEQNGIMFFLIVAAHIISEAN